MPWVIGDGTLQLRSASSDQETQSEPIAHNFDRCRASAPASFDLLDATYAALQGLDRFSARVNNVLPSQQAPYYGESQQQVHAFARSETKGGDLFDDAELDEVLL